MDRQLAWFHHPVPSPSNHPQPHHPHIPPCPAQRSRPALLSPPRRFSGLSSHLSFLWNNTLQDLRPRSPNNPLPALSPTPTCHLPLSVGVCIPPFTPPPLLPFLPPSLSHSNMPLPPPRIHLSRCTEPTIESTHEPKPDKHTHTHTRTRACANTHTQTHTYLSLRLLDALASCKGP